MDPIKINTDPIKIPSNQIKIPSRDHDCRDFDCMDFEILPIMTRTRIMMLEYVDDNSCTKDFNLKTTLSH